MLMTRDYKFDDSNISLAHAGRHRHQMNTLATLGLQDFKALLQAQ
jgi:hypothetical protein